LLLFLYVMEEAGRKCVWDMPWLLVAECNMITNKQTKKLGLNVCDLGNVSFLYFDVCYCSYVEINKND